MWNRRCIRLSLLLMSCVALGSVARGADPHPFGLVMGSSGQQEVLAAIEQAQGGGVEALRPPLVEGDLSAAEQELQSRYEGMPNPRETVVRAEALKSGNLSCEQAEFRLLEGTLYRFDCRIPAQSMQDFTALRDDLVGRYGDPIEGGDSAGSTRWQLLGNSVVLARNDQSGTLSFSDPALAARAEAARQELIANPILLMEEMRKSSQSED
jgi:hypothetical protein